MTIMTADELDELYQFTIGIARQAGDILMRGAKSRFGGNSVLSHTEKDNAVDLVTKTDEGRKSGNRVRCGN
jgi:myo-inositol-1(or 4)-monophosphatase